MFLAFIDRQSLHDVIANGRQGTPMPAFAKSSGGFLNAVQVNALSMEWNRDGPGQ